MTPSEDGPTVKTVSLGSGDMENIGSAAPQRQLSWSDFYKLQERIDNLEQHQPSEDGENVRLTESTIDRLEDTYELPESTYSLLMTEKATSLAFGTGVITMAFTVVCLVLSLLNLIDKQEAGNPFGKTILRLPSRG